MTFTIAIAGKGGTGKTTLAGILVDLLRQAGASPILAIDADPASNLNTVLDLPLERTVGDIREDTSEKARSGRLEGNLCRIWAGISAPALDPKGGRDLRWQF